MSHRLRVPQPMDVDIPSRFLDRFTVWDLLRIAIPASVGSIFGGPTGLLVGGFLGLLTTVWQPYGEKLDAHLRNAMSYKAESKNPSRIRKATFRDGTTVVPNGSVLGIVRVESCDLEMLADADVRANQSVVQDLLNVCDFPVQIHSRQRSQDLSGYPACGSSAIVTDHYVVVDDSLHSPGIQQRVRTKKGESLETRKERVQTRCDIVVDELNGGDLSAEKITGRDLKPTVERLHCWGLGTTWNGYTTQLNSQSRPEHRRMVYVSNYPRRCPVGWLADVLNTDGYVDVVQSITPLSSRESSRLSRKKSQLEAELEANTNPKNGIELVRAIEDVEDMLDVEIAGDVLVNYGVYIIAKGSSEAAVEKTLGNVKTTLRKLQVQYKEPVFQSFDAARADSALSPDTLDKTLIVPVTSASAGFAFSTLDSIEAGGIVFGTDDRNKMGVILNRFSWDAPHIVCMGMTGSGKTVRTMLEIIRSLATYPDLDIRIVDPKPDYGDLIEALGGETNVIDDTDFATHTPARIARYVVADPSQDNTVLLTEAVRHIYREACNSERKTIVVIDEAHHLLSDPDGIAAVNTLIRQGRYHSIGVTLLTQNSDDLTKSDAGRNILRNTGCSIFMRHQDVEHSATDFYGLSEREDAHLRKLRTGGESGFSEGIIRGPVNTKMRIRIDPDERDMVLSEDT